jgi:hypothetical protein
MERRSNRPTNNPSTSSSSGGTVVDARMSLAVWLRAGRAQKGMSLESVAKVTKIQPRILERLEAGKLEGLPAEVFVRGFIRSFARCVGLDEAEALQRYTAAAGSPQAPSAAARAFVESMSELAPASARAAKDLAAGSFAGRDLSADAILEAELLEAARVEQVRMDTERTEIARAETARIEALRAEADRLEAARIEADRIEAAKVEAIRVEAERLEVARLEAERVEAARLEAVRIEAERVEAARIEAERLEAEALANAELVRLDAERIATEQAAMSMSVAVENVVGTSGNKKKKRRGDKRRNKRAQMATGTPSAAMPVVSAELPVVEESVEAIESAEGSAPIVVAESTAIEVVDLALEASVDVPAEEEPVVVTEPWTPRMPTVVAPTVPWRRPYASLSAAKAPVVPSLVIDDADPDSADREREERVAVKEPGRRSFLPPILLDREDRTARQGGLTLAVIILLIAATLTLSYLMRRPSSTGDGVTMADEVARDILA